MHLLMHASGVECTYSHELPTNSSPSTEGEKEREMTPHRERERERERKRRGPAARSSRTINNNLEESRSNRSRAK